ncbi:MAG TPA: sugar phosphate isomerase/epimerase family protein [Methanoregulaceae archaeon]|nr:MAG: sugar phosphate isomerase/epimerase [Methanolinea sp.]HON82391.1 sugar phosphate isomerase/epimerase family protein [Methanoregulaceae archaeon]HPD10090.1 sugar phosphate isomerase/epimerase family protein [Methanoregulaceae archaeon]HRT15096.1 sugar phosphate isomerase/epimerase family protein [Methanoregulaceae archaeon]HRU30667.1 sugar phosphate isomerase/epimerase family protein [Methanoregulaceae archaeon]
MFGISSFCLHHEPLDIALDLLAEIADLIEVMDDGAHHIESPDLLESYSCRYTVHAPSRSINIASVHEPIRKGSVEVICTCFALSGEVAADVVIHPGYFAWREDRDKALRQFRKSLADLNACAEDYSIRFSIENMENWNYFFLRRPEEIENLGEFNLALDVGHAYLNRCLDEFLAMPFSHVHLHDNNGKEDLHAPVGQGTIDFGPVLKAIKDNHATPIIEVGTFEGALDSLGILSRMTEN